LPMQFLRRFHGRLQESWDDLLLVFAPAADSSLPLARFVYELKGKITVKEDSGQRKAFAKWKAFEPPKNGKLSTMHTFGLSRADVWSIDPGRKSGSGSIDRAVAVAHFEASAALELKLEVLRDDRPPRHVTIRGWPSSPEKRHVLLQYATRLADAASVDVL